MESDLNTVRLDNEAAQRVRWRPDLALGSRGSWHGRAWRLSQRAGCAIHGDAGRGGAVVRSVSRVPALDHAWRASVDGPRGSGSGAGLEQFTEPPSSTSGPLWGERPRTGAVCAAAIRRVL